MYKDFLLQGKSSSGSFFIFYVLNLQKKNMAQNCPPPPPNIQLRSILLLMNRANFSHMHKCKIKLIIFIRNEIDSLSFFLINFIFEFLKYDIPIYYNLALLARFVALIFKIVAEAPSGQLWALFEFILAGRLCRGGGSRGWSNRCTIAPATGHQGNLPTDTAHVDATLQPDVAVLTPIGAPTVLDEPVVNAALATIANHGDGVVQPGVVSAAGKDSLAVSAEGTTRDHSANHSSVLVHHLLEKLLVGLMSYVGPRNISTLN